MGWDQNALVSRDGPGFHSAGRAGVSAPEVLVTRRLPAVALERLGRTCHVDVHPGPDDLTPEQLRTRLSSKAGLVCMATDRIDSATLEAGPELQVVATVAVGVDNIDIEAASGRGIVVTNTPDVLTSAVAEHTWGLILSVTRRIAEGDRLIRAGAWTRWSLDFMLGTEVRGKRLGIVGAGRIGTAVAERAEAFGVDIVFSDRVGQPREARVSRADQAHRRVSLDELLVTSDIVSLHLPLTEATRHIIGRRELARMKRSAYLINMSRGSVVDESALAWALGERLLAGAALDVYENEPAVHPELLTLENVVLTPHIGSATRETRVAMAELAVANVLAVLSGKPPVTPVSASR